MDKKNQLEGIVWKDQAWRKQDGTEIAPQKIGDSFIVSSLIFLLPGNIPEAIIEELEEYSSLGYISTEQKKEINAYSIGKPIQAAGLDTIKSPISFYKI